MNDREKLIELLAKIIVEDGAIRFDEIADHLLANGVTVQKWIPVTERLPKESDGDRKGRVFAVLRGEEPKVWHWSLVADYANNFTHWMPLPACPEDGAKMDIS